MLPGCFKAGEVGGTQQFRADLGFFGLLSDGNFIFIGWPIEVTVLMTLVSKINEKLTKS